MSEDVELTYKQKVTSVRSMPQETPLESTQKKEAVQSLQIETYLSYARLITVTESILNNHPDIKYDELTKIFEGQKEEFSHPAVVDKFLATMRGELVLTNGALLDFRKANGLSSNPSDADVLEWKDEEKEQLGKFIFKSVSGNDPEGIVTVIDTTFGVGLSTENEKDLKAIRKNDRNIGGFYRHRATAKINSKNQDFPLIVVKSGPNSGGTIRHERGHAVNAAVQDVLVTISDQEFSNRWGGTEDHTIILTKVENEEQLSEFLEKQITPILVQNAKDEFLADYERQGNFDYAGSITKRHGIYDLTDKYIGVLETSGNLAISKERVEEAVNKYWDKYTEDIYKFAEEVTALNDLYRESGLESRRGLLPRVLVQVPLQGWVNTESRSYLGAFSAEIGLYLSLEAEIRQKSEKFSMAENFKEAKRKFEQIKVFSRKNPTKSLIPKLNECLQELDKLKN